MAHQPRSPQRPHERRADDCAATTFPVHLPKGDHAPGQPLKKSPNSTAKSGRKRSGFQRFARASARATGSPIAFAVAVMTIAAWAITGPIFHFSDTWQLAINTATTIVTFLMVFLIQNTQNRDSEAVQIKLDELIRATAGCHNAVLNIEELSETELDDLKRGYASLATNAIEDLRSGKSDCGTPEVKGNS